jgi:hypothetical protein
MKMRSSFSLACAVAISFTDFFFKDDTLLHYSIATSNGLFYPLAAALFWYCRPAYQKSVEYSSAWRSE